MTPVTPEPSSLTDAELRAEAVPVAVVGPPLPGSGPQLPTPETATATEVIRQQVSSQDYVVLRFAVIGLMLAILVSLIGVVFLAWAERELPDGIVAIGSASVGALATMLVRPPLFPPEPTRYIPTDRRTT
jgi:uncharacterized integral membrane protein